MDYYKLDRSSFSKKIAILSIFLVLPTNAFSWGEDGHTLIATYGLNQIQSATLANCHVTADELTLHVNDPDNIWKQKRAAYPHESSAHYIHINKLSKDWKDSKMKEDIVNGFLLFRIISWLEESKELRKKQKWNQLKEKLIGLIHYLGDLTQPLHNHSDYDGEAAGAKDIHSQFESKMVHRYKNEIENKLRIEIKKEKYPPYWNSIDVKSLIYGIAEQSNAKYGTLMNGAKLSQVNRPKESKATSAKINYIKPMLWKHTGQLATDQIILSSKLVAFIVESICH